MPRLPISLTSVAHDPAPAALSQEAWSIAWNVIFDGGETHRPRDDQIMYPRDGAAQVLLHATAGDVNWIIAAGPDGIFAWDGIAELDLTPTVWPGATIGEVWTATTTGGLPVINGSLRDPVWWDYVDTEMQPLPGWLSGGRTTAMRSMLGYLFAIGYYSDNVHRVRWSKSSEPGQIPDDWNPGANDDAGFVDLMPGTVGCLDAVVLRDRLIIYKGDSIHMARWIGGDFIFSFSKLFTRRGLLATNAIVAMSRQAHLFLDSSGDLVVTDGTTVRSLIEETNERYMSGLLDQPAQSMVWSALDRQHGTALIVAPRKQGGQFAISVDMTTLKPAFLDWPVGGPELLGAALSSGLVPAAGDIVTWADLATAGTGWDELSNTWSGFGAGQASDAMIAWVDDAVAGGSIVKVGRGAVATRPVSLVRTGISLGKNDDRKYLSRIDPVFNGDNQGNVLVRIGGSETANGPVTWSDQIEFDMIEQATVVGDITGRFGAVSIASNDQLPWQLSGFDLTVDKAGKW